MELYVDGDKWQNQGWEQLLMVLYDTDLTFELDHVQLPPEHPDEDNYTVIERISDESVALKRTDLSKKQVIFELRNLEENGLVDFVQPFEEHDIVVARLTASGFEVAHDKYRMQRDEEWRKQSHFIDITLTIATILLAVNAAIQLTSQISLDRLRLVPTAGLATTIGVVGVLLLVILRRRVKRNSR